MKENHLTDNSDIFYAFETDMGSHDLVVEKFIFEISLGKMNS